MEVIYRYCYLLTPRYINGSYVYRYCYLFTPIKIIIIALLAPLKRYRKGLNQNILRLFKN